MPLMKWDKELYKQYRPLWSMQELAERLGCSRRVGFNWETKKAIPEKYRGQIERLVVGLLPEHLRRGE